MHGVDAAGQTVFGKKLNRAKLSPFVANLAACTVATEAWGGAHDRARRFRAELNVLAEELRHLDERVAYYDTQIDEIARNDAQAQRLTTIPDIGAKCATALSAAVGEDPTLFGNGRALAAWLGLVPRQDSTGGRERLLGMRKRGDVYVYVRQLLIHGARAVLRWVERKEDPTSRWATALKARRHTNVAEVALGNKIARVAYAVMTSGKPYNPAAGKLLHAAV